MGLIAILVLSGIGTILAGNVLIDIFGLFRPVKGRKIRIHHNERISKYLLSFRYIPRNFNTIIIGTSLSDNLDVASYNHSNNRLKIYNSSVMGANIFDVCPVAKKCG